MKRISLLRKTNHVNATYITDSISLISSQSTFSVESSTCKSCGDLIDNLPHPTFQPLPNSTRIDGASNNRPAQQHRLVRPVVLHNWDQDCI